MKHVLKNKKKTGIILSVLSLLLAPATFCTAHGVPFWQGLAVWVTVYAAGAVVLWGRIKLSQA
jgi:hypothetical protein